MYRWFYAPLIILISYFSPLLGNDFAFLADKLFERECTKKYEYLAYWSPKEDFPSFGVGHFIWIPKSSQAQLEEQFPELLKYLQKHGVVLPVWLDPKEPCPWDSKSAFDADIERTQELRALLSETRLLQAQFIAQRFQNTMRMIENTDSSTKIKIKQLKKDPHGLYAMLDYAHFKGTGLNPKERYDGQGWGLLQVLQNMNNSRDDVMASFIESAIDILKKRTQLAPAAKHEERFLPGWIRRIQEYNQ